MPIDKAAPGEARRATVLASAKVNAAARELFLALSGRALKLVCAESCTGGLVTTAITDLPGSSAVLWGGVVAYSNECKTRLLGVSRDTLASHGAVSLEVAAEMAEGALAASGAANEADAADLSLSITGIAGPEGGSEGKPVGLVCFAWRSRFSPGSEAREIFPGDREAVREAAALLAIRGAIELAMGQGAIDHGRGR